VCTVGFSQRHARTKKKSLNKNGSSVTSAASAREVLAMPTPVANMPADMTKATQATTQSKFRYKMCTYTDRKKLMGKHNLRRSEATTIKRSHMPI
jgi:hypothetical protein